MKKCHQWDIKKILYLNGNIYDALKALLRGSGSELGIYADDYR
jgi:hypothetical protein